MYFLNILKEQVQNVQTRYKLKESYNFQKTQ